MGLVRSTAARLPVLLRSALHGDTSALGNKKQRCEQEPLNTELKLTTTTSYNFQDISEPSPEKKQCSPFRDHSNLHPLRQLPPNAEPPTAIFFGTDFQNPKGENEEEEKEEIPQFKRESQEEKEILENLAENGKHTSDWKPNHSSSDSCGEDDAPKITDSVCAPTTAGIVEASNRNWRRSWEDHATPSSLTSRPGESDERLLVRVHESQLNKQVGRDKVNSERDEAGFTSCLSPRAGPKQNKTVQRLKSRRRRKKRRGRPPLFLQRLEAVTEEAGEFSDSSSAPGLF